jgi:hypothetical protein
MGATGNIVVPIVVVIFCIGVIFHSGRLHARLEAIVAWREEVRDDLKYIRSVLDELRAGNANRRV